MAGIEETGSGSTGGEKMIGSRSGWVVAAALVVSAGMAFGQAEKTLNKCQKTASKETLKYVQQYIKTVSACADQISKESIQNGDPVGDAAAKCQKALLKVENTTYPDKTLAAKLEAKIGKACAQPPAGKAAHTEADIIGTGALGQQIEAMNLDAWCANFGGDGAVGDLGEWVSCLTEAATCAARVELATAYPRLLEWLNGVKPAILALDATCAGTCASCTDPSVVDACNALESLEGAIDGATDDDVPELTCGPASGGGGSGLPATGQTTAYGAGSDGAVQASLARSFTDNGDGTITDNVTGLMWEKKDDSGGIHDKDNDYTWGMTTPPYTMNGTMVTVLLDTLNDVAGGGANCFAGHCDWRIPNITEVMSLVNYDAFVSTGPMAYPEFHHAATCGGCVDVTATACSCSSDFGYWTSTTLPDPVSGDNAYVVYLYDSWVSDDGKNSGNRVRAVRGGL